MTRRDVMVARMIAELVTPHTEMWRWFRPLARTEERQ